MNYAESFENHLANYRAIERKQSENPNLWQLSSIVYGCTRLTGGCTIDLQGNKPKHGYSVALPGVPGKIVDLKTFDNCHIIDFIKDNKNVLSDHNNYLGLWVDEGRVYLDIVYITADRAHALRTARKKGEKAIYCLHTGQTILTKRTNLK